LLKHNAHPVLLQALMRIVDKPAKGRIWHN